MPVNRKAIGLRGVFKIKYHLNKIITKFKTWLVDQIFSQIVNIDYKELFIPIIKKIALYLFSHFH